VNRPRFLFTFAIICLLAIAVFAQPQSRNAVADEKEKKKKEELEQKALVMLDALIEECRGLRLPENRWWVLITAADLLWGRDEKRARTLYSEAISVYTQFASQIVEGSETGSENLRGQLQMMRSQTVQSLAPRDPQLASDFLAASRRPVNGDDQNPGLAEQETQLEMMLAQQLAAKNPQKALERAEAMIAAGKPLNLLGNILYPLREKDSEAAQKLANLIVAKMQAENPLRIESAYFAYQLISFAPAPGDEAQPNLKIQPLITSAQAKLLIEKLNTATQAEIAAAKQQMSMDRRNNVTNLLNQLKSITPYIEKYAPNVMPSLKRNWSEGEQVMEPSQRNWANFNQVSEKGSIDALLEAASKAPPEMQAMYYQRAAQIANSEGNEERARQIIKDNVRNSDQRSAMLHELNQHQLQQRISAGKFEEAQRLLISLKTSFERVSVLIQMAAAAQNSGKKELARKFLDDAWAVVGGPLESSQQFQTQLSLAGSYVQIDADRSFEILEGTIDKYNELFAASALLGSFEWHGTFREREMILISGDSSYAPIYSSTLGSLAAVDLERVQLFLRRCGYPDMRANITLILLRQLLFRPSSEMGGFGYGGSRGRGLHRMILN
jgi:ribosomal protein S20